MDKLPLTGTARRALLRSASCAAATLALPGLLHAKAESWRIGQTAALTGPLAWPFVELNKGVQAAFDEVNERGGVGGRPLQLISLDDGGSTEKAAANARQLAEQERALCMFACGGTSSVLGTMAVVQQARVPLIAPITGIDALRAHHPLVIHVRAGYSNELDRIVRQIGTVNMGRCAVAYSDTAFGKAGLAAFEAVARKHGNTGWKAFLIQDTPQGVRQGIAEIARFAPASYLSLYIGQHSLQFARDLRNHVQAPSFALSLLGSEPVLKALGPAGHGMTVAQVVPHPQARALPVVGAYQRAMQKIGHQQFTHASLEGYVSSRVLIEALRRSSKRDDTGSRLIEAFHTMQPLDLGGFELDYRPDKHLGSSFVELTFFNGSRYRR